MELLGNDEAVPSDIEFERNIPIAFRIAHQCSLIDSTVKKELHALYDDKQAISKFLRSQNEKINLLLGFMLSQLDDPTQEYQTETFGASSLTFTAKKTFEKGQDIRLKLFLENPPSAIYCYGNVYGCKEENGKYTISVKYTRLQEEDRDVLIRVALHQQQKLLRQNALEKNN
ncbi:PilZ domain-containing protein [Candidatus Enterovibrio escicola]|uniref:PilZ domain-containing protein n=1 Tax=Candidatus Enterovibrio escicola TaxID=1927127 RepID=UPI0037438D0F